MTKSSIGASPASLPTRTPEELESLLSLAMGAIERLVGNFKLAVANKPVRDMAETLAEASRVIAQIKSGQESMASRARNKRK